MRIAPQRHTKPAAAARRAGRGGISVSSAWGGSLLGPTDERRLAEHDLLVAHLADLLEHAQELPVATQVNDIFAHREGRGDLELSRHVGVLAVEVEEARCEFGVGRERRERVALGWLH